MKLLLAGDIGGTKALLGLYTLEKGPRIPLQTGTYACAAFPDLETLIGEFLKDKDWVVDSACLGVAGPVVEGRAKLTNLPWRIEEKGFSQALKIPSVLLMNDLTAMAHSIPLLAEGTDLMPLNAGSHDPKGNRAVIAPGTGLGEAFAVWDDSASGYRVHPSEGGHCDFAPRNDLETELMNHFRGKIGHVSYESICSGPGIRNIYLFLKETGAAKEPAWLAETLCRAADPTPFIIQHALDAGNPVDLCKKTLDIFISVLGTEAGNLALKIMATGGIYLGGGIPRRIVPLLSGGALKNAFADKGRFHGFLSRIPIHVILNPHAALIGAACRGLATLSPG